MSEWKKYKLSEIYTMSSGISSSKSQAGQGSPFLSFSTVFNNYFIPENLKDLMLTTKEEQEILIKYVLILCMKLKVAILISFIMMNK
ncbi:TPA: hypothetical protein TZE05_001021 [Streptococcus suis]|nr:hypothetical protein [Streptococcus suis]